MNIGDLLHARAGGIIAIDGSLLEATGEEGLDWAAVTEALNRTTSLGHTTPTQGEATGGIIMRRIAIARRVMLTHIPEISHRVG